MNDKRLIDALLADTAAGIMGWQDDTNDCWTGVWRGLPARVRFSHSGGHTAAYLNVNGYRVDGFEERVEAWAKARLAGLSAKLKERQRKAKGL